MPPNLAVFINSPKDSPIRDSARTDPFIDCGLCPRRDRDSPNMFSLAHEIGNHPMVFSNLQILSRKFDGLGSSQTAAKKDRNHRTVAFAAQVVGECFLE